ncbi:hypothetical protein [Hyunsoonleella rubra]|uniref:DNA topoisomerase IV n=1 Tax=Hyunsoonleella rubra TaxID=1737062 RepID=A0ABW5T9M6_9FLAO
MRKLVIIAASILLTSCYQSERNCSDFKTGLFRFEYTVDGFTKTAQFRRTPTTNINYYDNKVDSSKIRWINDCEFVLHKINPKSLSEKDPIHMKILSTTDSSYTFEYAKASLNEGEKRRVEKGTAIKIN